MPAFAESKPCVTSIHARLQLTLLVTLDHLLEIDRFDLRSIARGAERLVTRLADFLHRLDGGGEEFARIEFLRIVGHGLAQHTKRNQTQNKNKKDQTHAMLDAFDDLFHRYAIGLAH